MTGKIRYSTNAEDIVDLEVSGFFEGWASKPSEDMLRKSVRNADYTVLAIDDERKRLAGYITALSDGVLSAYIPFLEVEKTYQKQGIGHELVRKMSERLGHLYMVDLVCDTELAGFYERSGFKPYHAMIRRDYDRLTNNPK